MESTNNRSIKLSLRKTFFENYLRYIFRSPEGAIKVSRIEQLGKYLHSRVRYSQLPIKTKLLENSVELILPDQELDVSHRYFIYYNEDDMVRINDYIEAMAYLDFRMYVQVGSNDLNVDRKTVINLFSNVIFGEDRYEMLKKDEYRRRKKMERWLEESIKQYGY